MTNGVDLSNQFLIAMPTLGDPNFHQAVALVCEHNEEGALGVVINRPLEVTLSELMEHMEITPTTGDFQRAPVYGGGPVQTERGFILHQPLGSWESTLPIADDLGMTVSRDILAAIAAGEGPTRYLVTLGYAGWSAGQLEQELADNAWLTCPADPEIIFERPAGERWRAAASRLGVDLDLLAGDAGHA